MEKFKHNKTLFAAVLLLLLATSAYAVSPKVDKTASAKGRTSRTTRSPRVLLQKAIYAETTEGDLDKAIEIYQEVIERADKIEEIAARATYQLGMCYLKKGEKNKAAEYFQQAVSNYPTQKSIAKKAQKQLSNLQLPVANSIPMVIAASPTVYANDVSPSLDKINVTFNQPMMDGSWSWTGGGETFPEVTGKIHYNYSKTTCTLPVKLKAGNVYWIGINSPSHKNFKTQQRVPAKRYVIIFATKDKNGNATPIPKDRLARAKAINSASDKAAGWKEIYLPDADDVIQQGKAAVVLDLKTGKMLPGDKDKRYFNKLNKGDVAYFDDEGLDLLVCFRGAKITRKTANGKYSDTPDQSHTDNTIHIYIIKKTPAEWTITTKEGDIYDLKVLSLDNDQAKIKYRKIPAGGKVWTFTSDLSTPEATIKSFVKAVYDGNLEAAKACVSKDGHDYDEFKEMLATESNHPFQAMIKAMDASIPVEITSKDIKEDRCKIKWYFTLGRVYYIGDTKIKKGTHQEFSSYLELIGDKWLIRDI